MYPSLPASIRVRVSNPHRRDYPGKDMFSGLSTDKWTGDYCKAVHYPSLYPKIPRTELLQGKIMNCKFQNFSRNGILRLFHTLHEVNHGQKTFSAHSSNKYTQNYNTECSNRCSKDLPSHLAEDKSIELWKDKMVSYIYSTLSSNARARLSHP